jgi:ribonuclease HI
VLLNTDYISLTLEMIMLTRDTLITLLVLWLTTQYTLSAMLTYVLVLKDKYMSTRRREGNPVAIPSDSVLWKAICKEWDTVNQNATWNVGNGKRILFWRDSWLESYGPIINHLEREVQVETLDYTVADMVDDRGNWKWDVFAHLIPMQIVMSIVGYTPPMQDGIDDMVGWDHSSNGKLTVRTAYMVLEERGEMDQDPIWRLIRKWQGMERIKVFLWTVAHNSIMTNDLRYRRHLTANRFCDHCGTEVETLTHALRDCPKARKIWEVFVKVENRELFFSQNWYAWLVSNMSARNRNTDHGAWSLEFGIALWYIWKERCNRVFGVDQGNWFRAILAIKRMVRDTEFTQRHGNDEGRSSKEDTQVGWKYPQEERIKLNVDGCSKGNPGVAGAGGVIRDHLGAWIGGFARNIGICSSVNAELWAVYVGLQLAWDRGFRKVDLESDSKVVVGLINGDSVRVDRNYNIIMQIKGMLGRDWEVTTYHVYREANCVADWLANYGLTRDLLDRGSDVLEEPPSGLYPLLYYDLIGSTVTRSI